MSGRHRVAMLAAVALLLGASTLTRGQAGGNGSGDDASAKPIDAGGATRAPAPGQENILRALRARTDSILSVDVLTFSEGFRDSAVAAFDSTVAADGLGPLLSRYRQVGPGTTDSGSGVGVSHDFRNADVGYSKVDGLSVLLPLRGRFVGHRVRVEAGGRIGYAFASERGRHDAGIVIAAHGVTADVRHVRLAERFGWTSMHGYRFFALAGWDEQSYLERRGWSAGLATRLPGDLDLRLSFHRETQSARRARAVFTLGDASAFSERNRTADAGDLRAFALTVGLPRDADPQLWGELSAETAGRGLGGDLEYDRLQASLSWIPVLPWDDELLLVARAQAAAAPDSLPEQVLADPAGRSGLRGYPLLSIVGSHALALRLDYRLSRDLFAMARIPGLRALRLQLVPFMDVGAAWTPPDDRSLDRSTLPESHEWKWSTGIGVRKGLGFGSILSHARLDVAWRLDRDAQPPVVYVVLEGEPFD